VLLDHVRETDRKLGLSNDYIKDAKKRNKEKTDNGENGNSYSHSVMDIYEQDEDMMADM
jgi:hypothetical protein